jgi:cytochrome c-type biogenesis protein CcmE
MALKNRDGGTLIMLVTLLLASQIYLGSISSAAADEAEHNYVVFQDDFEDGEAGDWTIEIPDDAPLGSSWAVELDDGNHVLSMREHMWAEAGDYLWTNYTFEVKVKMLSSTGSGHISVRRAGSPRYFAQFWATGMVITKEYMDTFTEEKHTQAAFHVNTWYDFKIVCIGNSIWVYVDDVLKFDYVDEDNPILSGRIALESCPDSHIYFDDVKVSTTFRLYVEHLVQEAQNEIYKAKMVEAETIEAEQKLAEAQAAFSDGDLSSAESLAEEAINLAEQASVGATSVDKLLKYSAEYDQRTVEVSGTIRDIRFPEGVYSFVVDDGTGVISVTFNGTLGEIKTDDKVKVTGLFNASNTTVTAESLEKVKSPTEGLYTFLIFKDDFEDGDFSGWMIHVESTIEGSLWEIVMEDDNHVLSGEGMCGSWTGDPEWTDYIFEVKVKLVNGWICINFRRTHLPEGAESYYFGISDSQELRKMEMYLNELQDTLLKRVNLDIDYDVWYTVKIVCLGNNIKVYLDDDLKLDYTDEDNPLLSGFIGLETVTPQERQDYPSHVLYDDVKVSKIATTSDIDDLITYAQSEIDEAREINADVTTAELKLEQAEQALAQEEYQMVQYLVDEAVWLAKRASVGQISIRDLMAQATKMSGHTVIVTGTVKDLEARIGVGYDWVLDDNTGGISVSYQGVLVDMGNDYKVKVTGVFDAPSETVTASSVEKISGPPAQQPSVSIGPVGITWSLEEITLLISICGTVVGVIGWMARHHGMEKKRKILFKKLMEEIDDVYSRFKMNTRRCEGELQRLKNEVLDEFKEGMIDEDNYNVLDRRIDDYLKEVKEQIDREKLQQV